MKAKDEKRPVLRTYLRVQERADREMYFLLRRTSADIDKMIKDIPGAGIGDALRRDQLMIAKKEIETRIAAMMREVGRVIDAGRHEAAAAAVEAGLIYERVIARKAGITPAMLKIYKDGAVATAQKNIEAAMERLLGSSYVELAESVYKTTTLVSGMVDRQVDQALAAGLTAREFARKMTPFIRPDVPGGVSYAAMRLARTEINNAFHATQVMRAVDSEWVTAVKWNLSESHPQPDECDEYSENELDGFEEPGLFIPTKVPMKPHPQCLCFMTYELIEQDEFVKMMQDILNS